MQAQDQSDRKHGDELLTWWGEQVRRQGSAVAVRDGLCDLTYREMDEQGNRLAHWLRERGVTDDVVVAICQQRGWRMVVSVLATLKAGGAYLPLDPHYPAERLTFMLDDSRAAVLLASSGQAELFPEFAGQRLLVDRDWHEVEQRSIAAVELAAVEDRLAYVIYTSGSTGRPKGVAMGRRALANLIAWQGRSLRAGAGTRTLQYTPLSFDVHFQEIFGAWSTGGTLVLVADEVRLDPLRLLEFVERERIERLFLPFVALANLAEVAVTHGCLPRSLREVITAGEQLKITAPIVAMFSELPNCSLHNHYGPSETHVVTALELTGAPSTWPALPAIGWPIDGAKICLWDDARRPVTEGTAGELYVAGVPLARGYLNRPELTSERFIEQGGERYYRTGDLAERMPDGALKFLGRADGQVKLRGYRIELGEIEAALGSLPAVQAAAATVLEDEGGEKRLVGYVVATAELPDLQGWRKALSQRLPEYMVPTHFVRLEALPLTPSGKVDRRALPAPSSARPELLQEYVAPTNEWEEYLCEQWRGLLKLDRVGTRDNFFDLGGTSLLAMRCVSQLEHDRGVALPIASFFERSTIAGIVEEITGTKDVVDGGLRVDARRRPNRSGEPCPIAIIGMEGQFPGAENVEQLWRNLCAGLDSVTLFALEELDPSVRGDAARESNYVRARGILPRGAEWFDAKSFGIMPGEAEILDPQQRLFLETVWQALERAGYMPERMLGTVGVYAGAHNNSYYPLHLATRPDVMAKRGAFQVMVANEKDYLATRVAHKLNLTGPALSINTACSTSLVAVAEACAALEQGTCDMAVAGGVAVTFPQRSGYCYQPEGILSPDGHCRPFDEKARGTTFSDGVGVVVLKRLDEAVRDGDHVHAVIRGWAVNNDGGEKASFSAPSVRGQATVIATAQAKAEVEPETISYVEAHGTATPLGDPIEVEALTRAFRAGTDRVGFCALGSVKSNLGHLTAAAGVAGLIKTALALEHKSLPPTVHFERANPQLRLEESPFYVNRELMEWPAGGVPRRAGVSSFGVGGTNAHLVLEEAPTIDGATAEEDGPQLLVLSARSEEALLASAQQLASWWQDRPDVSLMDAAYTLQVGRRAFARRACVVAETVAEATAALEARDARNWQTSEASAEPGAVAWMFPGQGAQYVRMGAGLYRDAPAFRRSLDDCAERLTRWLDRDVRDVLFATSLDDDAAGELLRQTKYLQPALFTVEHALAQLWLDCGVRPAALVGHSVGEFVAACVAGVFSLDDGLRIVATRGGLMQEMAPGAMLSVRLPAEEVLPRLTSGLALAAINAPALCVVSGATEEVDRLAMALNHEGVACKRLHTSHAFHSPLVDPVVEVFAATMREIELRAPSIPIVSTATGEWLSGDEATDPMYWARHLRETVRFSAAVKRLSEDASRVLLEVGPRGTLTTLARQSATSGSRTKIVASLGDTAAGNAETRAWLGAVGRLWVAGVNCGWPQFGRGRTRRVPLPTYPFERQAYIVEPGIGSSTAATTNETPSLPAQGVVELPKPVEETMTKLHAERLLPQLWEIFADLSGLELDGVDPATSFLELGMDSLMLTQAATELKRQFGVEISFRQLIEQYCSPSLVAEYLAEQLPEEAPMVEVPAAVESKMLDPQIGTVAAVQPPRPTMQVASMTVENAAPLATSEVAAVVQEQLRIMAQQLAVLGGSAAGSTTVAARVAEAAVVREPALANKESLAPVVESGAVGGGASEAPKPFGAAARISLQKEQVDAKRQRALDELIERYCVRTARSKALTQQHRSRLADPRVVSGFRPQLKEIIYPLIVERSQGSKLWDVDGNEYIDLTCGFGSNFLGNSAACVVDAVREQLERGYEIGPQHPLAGEVAELVTRMTGLERVAFCNTGSEAVLGAMRIARTVTGRDTIVMFHGAYHGIVDEVIVRSAADGRSLPAAAGIPRSAVQNVLLVDYGTDEALEILRRRGSEIAGVLVEPVQSRRPDLQPREFLHKLRALTSELGAALIFDEVITGFRVAAGGAQAEFGVRADVATYGKVVGGGLPIGVIAGQGRFMDALDGGAWQFGDGSSPQAGVTYFAGTFVRHPLALAAARAVLREIESQGAGLYEELNARTTSLVAELNGIFDERGAPLHAANFGSLFKCAYTEPQPWGDLLFSLLRHKGIHIWDARPCFLTTAHSAEDLRRVVAAFRETVTEMQTAGFLPPSVDGVAALNGEERELPVCDRERPPVPGARLGRDSQGNAAWFVAEVDNPGQFVQVGVVA